MAISKFRIVRKLRDPRSIQLVNLKHDFGLEKEGTLEAEEIIRDKNFSLYCIDQQERVAAFIQTSERLYIENAAFLYQKQYKYAENVVCVPYEVFFRVFEKIYCQMKNVCLVFSVGRCGSTLLQKMLGVLPGVNSISEADVYSQVSELLRMKQIDAAEACAIFKCATIHFWNNCCSSPNDILLLKFRSEVITSYAEIYRAIPTEKSIFMYRNATDVIQSFNRMLGFSQKHDFFLQHHLFSSFNKWWVKKQFRKNEYLYRDFISPLNLKGISTVELVALLRPSGYTFLWWLLKVNLYLKMRVENIPIVALRYEDLISNPEKMLCMILAYLKLPAKSLVQACGQVRRDSQEGTNLARDSMGQYILKAKERDSIAMAIRLYTDFSGPDHILSGTLGHYDA
jgi:hypothetical protein